MLPMDYSIIWIEKLKLQKFQDFSDGFSLKFSALQKENSRQKSLFNSISLLTSKSNPISMMIFAAHLYYKDCSVIVCLFFSLSVRSIQIKTNDLSVCQFVCPFYKG